MVHTHTYMDTHTHTHTCTHMPTHTQHTHTNPYVHTYKLTLHSIHFTQAAFKLNLIHAPATALSLAAKNNKN